MNRFTAFKEFLQNKVEILFYVLLMILPIIVTSVFCKSLYNIYWIPKSFYFLICFLGLSLFYTIIFMIDKQKMKRLLNMDILLVFLFQLVLILSAVFSQDSGISVYGAYWRQFGLIIVLPISFLAVIGVLAFKNRGRIHLFLATLTIAGGFYALFGIIQKFGVKAFNVEILYGRAAGLQGNPDFYAPMLLLLCFPAASFMVKFLTQKKYVLSVFFSGILLLYIAAIISTMTRGTWVGVFIGSVVWFIFICRFIWKQKIWLIITSAIACFVIVAGIFYGITKLDSRLAKHRESTIEKLTSTFTLKNKTGLTNQRLYLWRDSMKLGWDELIKGHVFGVGWEVFNRPFLPYKSLELAQVSKEIVYDNPHNQYIDMFVKTGPFGVLIFVLLFAWPILKALCFIIKSKRVVDKVIMIGLLSAFVGYGVNLFGIFPTISSFIVFFLYFGMITAMCYPGWRVNHDGIKYSVSRFASIVWMIAIIVIAIIGMNNFKEIWKADELYEKGRVLALRSNTPIDKIDEALRALERAVTRYPRETFYMNEFIRVLGEKANYFVKRRDYKKADSWYNKSAILAEKSETTNWQPDILYLTLAINTFRLGYLDHAIMFLEKAIEYDHWCYKAHTSLGAINYYRYKLTKNQENLLNAYQHSYITAIIILRYAPYWDAIAMNNTFKYGFELYRLNKDPILLENLMEAYDVLASNGGSIKELDRIGRSFRGTEYERTIKATRFYSIFKSVLKSKTLGRVNQRKQVTRLLKNITKLNLKDDRFYKKYVEDMKAFMAE